jgi:hypothetical protein
MGIHEDSHLTPKQSVDVIRYFHDGENRVARQNGWKDKTSIGQAAMYTISARHSILPHKTPMLTAEEMNEGLDYIDHPPKSDAYYEEAERRVDMKNISYDQAYRELDEEGWE